MPVVQVRAVPRDTEPVEPCGEVVMEGGQRVYHVWGFFIRKQVAHGAGIQRNAVSGNIIENSMRLGFAISVATNIKAMRKHGCTRPDGHAHTIRRQLTVHIYRCVGGRISEGDEMPVIGRPRNRGAKIIGLQTGILRAEPKICSAWVNIQTPPTVRSVASPLSGVNQLTPRTGADTSIVGAGPRRRKPHNHAALIDGQVGSAVRFIDVILQPCRRVGVHNEGCAIT